MSDYVKVVLTFYFYLTCNSCTHYEGNKCTEADNMLLLKINK